jgi:heme A synthase
MFGIATLIGLQGLMGWYMVKSGLDKDHELMKKYNNIPRVSQYRLASHLSLAFIIYGSMFWNYLNLHDNRLYSITKNIKIVKNLKWMVLIILTIRLVLSFEIKGTNVFMFNIFNK